MMKNINDQDNTSRQNKFNSTNKDNDQIGIEYSNQTSNIETWFEFGGYPNSQQAQQAMQDEIKYWDNVLSNNNMHLKHGLTNHNDMMLVQKYNIAIQASQGIINHMILQSKCD